MREKLGVRQHKSASEASQEEVQVKRSLSEDDTLSVYTAISRKVVGKIVYATVPKGDMGYDLYTFPNDCSCRIYFCSFHLAAHKHTSIASHATLSYFFEEQWTKNHPQYLSGLSSALFLRTFLEKAVYSKKSVLFSLRFCQTQCKFKTWLNTT